MRKFILIAVVLLSSTIALQAKSIRRIRFKKAATTIVVAGSMKSLKDENTFVIRLREGQMLAVDQVIGKVTSVYITINILSPKGEEMSDVEANCNNHKTVKKTMAGDYKIEVTNCGATDITRGSYKLKFTVK